MTRGASPGSKRKAMKQAMLYLYESAWICTKCWEYYRGYQRVECCGEMTKRVKEGTEP